jgi:hypothetical protein
MAIAVLASPHISLQKFLSHFPHIPRAQGQQNGPFPEILAQKGHYGTAHWHIVHLTLTMLLDTIV